MRNKKEYEHNTKLRYVNGLGYLLVTLPILSESLHEEILVKEGPLETHKEDMNCRDSGKAVTYMLKQGIVRLFQGWVRT